MSLSTPSTLVPSLGAGAHDAAALAARRKAFRALHERGCFVIPNPWDVGSARYLQHLGFPALATTSAGFAFSQGLPDSADDVVVSRDRSLAHIASITAAVDVPVTADFMSGYGLEPEDVAESVARCVATGVAGLSIEDATGDPTSPLYELPIAVERVRAARQAIDESGRRQDVLLTARAECYHVGPSAIRSARSSGACRRMSQRELTCSSRRVRRSPRKSRRSSRRLRQSRSIFSWFATLV